MDWESSFVAVGVLLGESLEAMRASLAAPMAGQAARLVTRLEAPSRQARARALGRAVSEVALAVEAVRLA
jgi:hypothetical protein